MHISEVVNYIKDTLTANNLVDIELTDEQIINIIKEPLLAMLDQYIPALKVYEPPPELLSNWQSSVTIEIPDENIVSVVKVLPDYVFGLTKYSTVPMFLTIEQALSIYNNLINKTPGYALTTTLFWKFYPPNKLSIFNIVKQAITIIYVVRHSADLSTVPEAFRWTVYKIALALVKKSLGMARRKYATFNTPFGQIDIFSTDLYSEGVQELKEIEEELKTIPPVVPLLLL